MVSQLTQLAMICKIMHTVSWTYIHQSWSAVIPLHSSLFLKVHSPVVHTPSPPAELGREEFMLLCLGDIHLLTPVYQMMLFSSWLIQQCWSLVSRTHTTVQYTGLCANWHCPTLWINWMGHWHTLGSNWLCLQPPVPDCASGADWNQLLHHFISLIPRPFSCPALIACNVTDWKAGKHLSNTGVYVQQLLLLAFRNCGSHCHSNWFSLGH